MPDTPQARFVISIDLEMSWGAIHHGSPHDDAPYRSEREIVTDVLDAMDRHGISATWATVGHLFLAECGGGETHNDIVRPTYPWMQGDWYDLDPAGSVATAPTWYGPDLIDAIEQCPTPQEIGCHSFGHLIAGEPGCSAEAFATDLAACQRIATARGIDLTSFVYPRNSIGHRDVLAESGFRAYRGPAPKRFVDRPTWMRKPLGFVDQLRPFASETVQPSVESTSLGGNMVNVPQTYLFNPASKTADQVGTERWSKLVRRRLRHAIATSSLFHMWFHTHNLVSERTRARRAMDLVFADARRAIDAGDLQNPTMGAVANELLS